MRKYTNSLRWHRLPTTHRQLAQLRWYQICVLLEKYDAERSADQHFDTILPNGWTLSEWLDNCHQTLVRYGCQLPTNLEQCNYLYVDNDRNVCYSDGTPADIPYYGVHNNSDIKPNLEFDNQSNIHIADDSEYEFAQPVVLPPHYEQLKIDL